MNQISLATARNVAAEITSLIPEKLEQGLPSWSRPIVDAACIRDLVKKFPALTAIVDPLRSVRRTMRRQLVVLHKTVIEPVHHDRFAGVS